MLDFSDKKAKKKPDCNINICVPFFIEKFWFEKLVNTCCSDKLPRRTNLRHNFRRMKGRKQWNKTRISRRNNNNYIYYAVYSYLGSELSRRNKCFFHFFPPPPRFFLFFHSLPNKRNALPRTLDAGQSVVSPSRNNTIRRLVRERKHLLYFFFYSFFKRKTLKTGILQSHALLVHRSSEIY